MDTSSSGDALIPDVSDASRESLAQLASLLNRQMSDDSASGEAPFDEIELLVRLLGRDASSRLGIYAVPPGFLLSVIMPVYNEAATVERVIERVRATDLPLEIILVDDGSTDGTREVLEGLQDQPDLKVVFHEKNQGKGAALKAGFLEASGDIVVIQDADMEYDPSDFRLLIQPIIEDTADVVYGSRYSGADRAVSPLWHLAANKIITNVFNIFHGYRFTDVETCYKVFRRKLIQELAPRLRENRFGIELEITARLLRDRSLRFHERPIRYARRSYAEGKKIGWRDGLWAFWCIIRY